MEANRKLAAVAGFISRFIAFILAVIFVVSTLAVFLVLNVQRELLRPESYKQALAEQGIYERFPALAADQILLQDTGDVPEQLRYLTREDYEAILTDLLPSAWVQGQVEVAIDQAFSFLDSGGRFPAVRISLAEVRERLSGGEEGIRIVMRIVRSWPPCTEEQLQSWVGSEDLPICRPPEEILTALAPTLGGLQAELAASQIPDELDLTGSMQGGDVPDLAPILMGVRLIPFLPVVLLILITLLTVRSLRGLLRWWGLPLLFAGLAGFGLALATPSLVEWSLGAGSLDSGLGALPGDLIEIVHGVVRSLAGSLAGGIAAYARTVALIGLTFAVGSFFIPTPRRL